MTKCRKYRYLKMILVPTFVSLFFSFTSCAEEVLKTPQTPLEKEGLEIQELITQAKESINEAIELSPADFPFKLKSLTLILQSSIVQEGKGGFKFFFIKVGGNFKKENASTMTIALVPPPSPPEKQFTFHDAAFQPELKPLLTKAIINAENGLSEASKSKPELVLDNLTIEIKFVVGASGGAEATLTLIPVEAGVDYTKDAVHCVKLEFTRK